MESIKHDALQGMRRDVRNMNGALDEDSYSFQAAMVLFASEVVGPYSDRIATVLGYPSALVQVMAARLQEAKICQDDHVHCESWFDPENGAVAFMLDLMVTEGQFVRRWSEENDHKNSSILQLKAFPACRIPTNDGLHLMFVERRTVYAK